MAARVNQNQTANPYFGLDITGKARNIFEKDGKPGKVTNEECEFYNTQQRLERCGAFRDDAGIVTDNAGNIL